MPDFVNKGMMAQEYGTSTLLSTGSKKGDSLIGRRSGKHITPDGNVNLGMRNRFQLVSKRIVGIGTLDNGIYGQSVVERAKSDNLIKSP